MSTLSWAGQHRENAKLRYQLAVERAQAETAAADLARLRAEVARLRMAVGEIPTPAPIVVAEPPPPVSRAAPPRPKRVVVQGRRRQRGGWMMPFLLEHGPITIAEIVEATGRPIGACRKAMNKIRAQLTAQGTGNGPELRYSVRAAAAAG